MRCVLNSRRGQSLKNVVKLRIRLIRLSYTHISTDTLNPTPAIDGIHSDHYSLIQAQGVAGRPTSPTLRTSTLVTRRSRLASTLASHTQWIAGSSHSGAADSDRVFDVVAVTRDTLAPVAGVIGNSEGSQLRAISKSVMS